jgi:hypothetical protein
LSATYTNTDGVYSIGYPSAWTVSPLTIANTSGTVQIESPDRTDLVIIEPFTLKSSAPYPYLLEGGISNSLFTNSKVNSAVTTQTYPSGSWTVAHTTTDISGTPYTVRLYGTLHDDHTFVIFVLAPTSAAATDQATYFDLMLNSLTFLK